MNFIVILSLLVIATFAYSDERNEADFLYEANGRHLDSCSTEGFFEEKKTKITFYGDSRMDLVDGGGWNLYGRQPMFEILNRKEVGEYISTERFEKENIQNLGVSGFTTTNILDHLNKCLPKPSYKIGRRIVYHAGGNNFLQNGVLAFTVLENAKQNPLSALALPFFFELTKNVVRDEILRTVKVLKSYGVSMTNPEKFDILLVGSYSTGFFYTPPQNFSAIENNCRPFTVNRNVMLASSAFVSPQSPISPIAWCSLTNSLPQDVQNQFNPSGYGQIGVYKTYLNAGLFFSAGLHQMNAIYQGIADLEKVHFLSVWDQMFDLRYVSADLIHPSELGFNQWGKLVGKKLRDINFHSDIRKVNLEQPPPTNNKWIDAENNLRYAQGLLRIRLAEYEEKKRELEERERKLREIQEKIRDAEYKLSLIKKRIQKIDLQIAETKAKINDLDIQIADAILEGKLEIAKKLEETKRIEEERKRVFEEQRIAAEQARIQKEQEIALLEAQRIEAEHHATMARQAAEAAHQAYLDAQTRERAAAAAAEQARRDQEFLQLLALCVFFGICR